MLTAKAHGDRQLAQNLQYICLIKGDSAVRHLGLDLKTVTSHEVLLRAIC
jgi:hypothetical protein